MALQFHPQRGTIVTVRFEPGFIAPEMIKTRPCIVLSTPQKHRPKLLTVVALSTTPPHPVLPCHCEITIPMQMPTGWASTCWVKGDMVNTVGFHRSDLLKLGKDRDGRRMYQIMPLPDDLMRQVTNCVLAGLGVLPLAT
jgi:uncharacterized protein YifN (PemK superfamily)